MRKADIFLPAWEINLTIGERTGDTSSIAGAMNVSMPRTALPGRGLYWKRVSVVAPKRIIKIVIVRKINLWRGDKVIWSVLGF